MAKRQASDPQFEILFFEKVLEKSPYFIEALMCLGDLYTKEGLLEKGLRIDQRLAELRPDDAVVFYNLACSYSLTDHLPDAERAMRRAVALGYDDFEYLSRDPDLVNLLNTETFRAYLQGMLDQRRGPVEESA